MCVKPVSSGLKAPIEQTDNQYVNNGSTYMDSNGDQEDNKYKGSIGDQSDYHYYHKASNLMWSIRVQANNQDNNINYYMDHA